MDQHATVRFEPTGRTTQVPVGSTLLAAARLAGVEVDAPCGGLGRCGSCRVRATGELVPPSAEEQELLGGAGVAAGIRLACRARAAGDVTVTVPERTGATRVVTQAEYRPFAVESPARRGIEAIGQVLGAAVDLGTTTVAVLLVDLTTGEVLAVAGGANDQRSFGADVLSRVAHANDRGGRDLQKVAVDQLDMLLGQALQQADASADRLAELVVVGNVAMTGLLLGKDVGMLGEAPYKGAPVAEYRVPAHTLGLAPFATLDVLVPPGISAFIGSDITSGILATGLADRDEPTLSMDLGTNGEIVLSVGGEMIAASTAAGPALEGATITCGMRAEPGAIERVTLARTAFELGVIGEAEPTGICGSGLLDLVAALLEAGVIDSTGAFTDVAEDWGDRLTELDGVRAFTVTGDVVLTQKDIRQVQLAVGAIKAGIELLLDEAGMMEGAIARILVAGGFGYHVRADSLVRLGLLAPVWAERVTFVGNTALAGARMYLLSSALRQEARDIVPVVHTLDLAAHSGFQELFVRSLDFPA
jgi:uncharacterized 2Fe-2S/4Fe-4S cluster protein (DUF4445 family)